MIKKSPAPGISKCLLLLFYFCAFTTKSFANSANDNPRAKANFILEVAYNIYYSDNADANVFKIGVYGRDSEAKAIYEKLIAVSKDLTVNKKPITVSLFKNMRSVESVDIIYLSGNAKIRLADLHERLNTVDYSLITDNYPFGTSLINMSVDSNDELIFEIQPTPLRKNGATIRRKILENRQRIANAADWEEAKTGKKQRKRSGVAIVAEAKDSTTKDTILKSSVTEAELIDSEIEYQYAQALADCRAENEELKASGSNKFNWLLTFSILTIAALIFYITRLKK